MIYQEFISKKDGCLFLSVKKGQKSEKKKRNAVLWPGVPQTAKGTGSVCLSGMAPYREAFIYSRKAWQTGESSRSFFHTKSISI